MIRPGAGRPVPTAGIRPTCSSLPIVDRPRTIKTTATSTNGMAVGRPGWLQWSTTRDGEVTRDWATPMAMPAAVVTGKDENRPITAAARTGMTRKEALVGSSPVMGASNIVASAPRAEPMAQLAAAIFRGETARADAAWWFSATALVATPNHVNR